MKLTSDQEKRIYFVDEAGDMTLFNGHGACIVGDKGVSKYFMVGHAKIEKYNELESELSNLRNQIVHDPYYKNVPSLKSTAIHFHACKDLPEVRMEVFRILSKYRISAEVAIRRKKLLAEYAKLKFLKDGSKVSDNEIYDELVTRIFRNCLHKSDCAIFFSRRGKSERSRALEEAIAKAKLNFYNKYKIPNEKNTQIYSRYPYEVSGLQVIDYLLWALLRFYERGEGRFFEYVRDKYKIIMDLDDKSNKEYGQWYNDKANIDYNKIKALES